MSDAELLFLAMVFFYFAECCFWLRPGMFVFSTNLGQRQHWINLRWALLRNPDGGILLGNLLPFGQASICQQWPLSMSPDGIYSFVSQAFSSDGRPRQPERFIRYADIRQVEASGHELLINGTLFARTAVPAFAWHLAHLIRKLQELPAEQRGQAIAARLSHHLDHSAVSQRLALLAHPPSLSIWARARPSISLLDSLGY